MRRPTLRGRSSPDQASVSELPDGYGAAVVVARRSPPSDVQPTPGGGPVTAAARPETTYLLPLKRPPGSGALEEDLRDYLRWIGARRDLIVVDGSAAEEFAEAHRDIAGVGLHVVPDDDLDCANGKVRGVLSGMRRVRTRLVIIGDDDVRYDEAALRRVEELLAFNDLVVPQNFFSPRPWHALWDTGRTLLNRSGGTDYPGTIALHRALMDRSGGYDGDVLFENLELVRTAQAMGARCAFAPDLFVVRRPPSARKFREQRVRQAYDELARPPRFVLELCTLPVVLLIARRRPAALLGLAAVVVAIAERGRRRAGGRAVFPWSASVCAPAWVIERGVCSWIALLQRLRGGCPYAGRRLRVAANSPRVLARRHAGA